MKMNHCHKIFVRNPWTKSSYCFWVSANTPVCNLSNSAAIWNCSLFLSDKPSCLILRAVCGRFRGRCPSSTSHLFILASIHHTTGGLRLADNLRSVIGLRNPRSANSSYVYPTAARAGNDEMIIYISLLANKGKKSAVQPYLTISYSYCLYLGSLSWGCCCNVHTCTVHTPVSLNRV